MALSPHDFVPFALARYRQPGLEALCIELQDSCAAQVNLLLWACWLDEQGAEVNGALWSRACGQLARSNHYWVIPLRSLRRRWSKRWYGLGLRRVIKALELRAEFWQLEQLANLATGLPQREGEAKEVKTKEVKTGYLARYLGDLRVSEPLLSRSWSLRCSAVDSLDK